MVTTAFDLYATGEWTTRRLAEHLEQQGLRSRETPKVPSRPLRLTAIQEMLRNPYYIGIVVYRRKRVPGRHKRLVDPDTFDRVQALLSARSVAGDRPHKHQHYLSGSLYCAICGGRLLYSKHRGNGGVYEYFCCIGRSTRRQGGTCPSRHYSAMRSRKPSLRTTVPSTYLSEYVRRSGPTCNAMQMGAPPSWPRTSSATSARSRHSRGTRPGSCNSPTRVLSQTRCLPPELTPVYAALSAWEPRLGKPRHLKAVPSPTKGPGSANLDPVSRGQGSHNDSSVADTGHSANRVDGAEFEVWALDIGT